MTHSTHRRAFVHRSLVVLAALGLAASAAAQAGAQAGATPARAKAKAYIKKAIKFSMVEDKGTILERFELVKSLGFDGVEMDSPSSIDKQAVCAARDKTGLVIHGVVDSTHWAQRFSDASEAVRAKAVADLREAIADCKLYGGTTVLVVPGQVTNPDTENYEQVWSRSQAEIKKVLPEARAAGVKIAIEVVWNDFIKTPEELCRYVDEFKDSNVGAYFDCSNMIKFGTPSAAWIQKLGPRLLKFDFKGYSSAKGWVGIGEGDENWPEVRKALDELRYDGWATAEVQSGGREFLADVKDRMDRALAR